MFYNLANLFLRFAFWLLTDVEITGLENVPKEGSLMIITNHLSNLDGMLLGATIPRHIRWMAKEEGWHNPILGLILNLYGVFPVRRGMVDRKAMARAIEVLRTGGVLGIAPEGTRSRIGKLARAKPGAARLALEAECTILPVGIAGTEQAVHALTELRRPVITLRIGRPFKLEMEHPVSKEKQQEVADQMMCRIADLLPLSYRGVYGGGETR